MKRLLLVCALLTTGLCLHAQQYATLAAYPYAGNWTIRKGDTLVLHQPQDATFISVTDKIPADRSSHLARGEYNNRMITVDGLEKYSAPGKKVQVFARVKIGGEKYYIDIDRAVYEHEIVLPDGVSRNKDYTPFSEQELLTRNIDSIPVSNGKIFYDKITEMPGASREAIFTLLRTVCNEQFSKSRYVPQVDDAASGRLMGMAFYSYMASKGHTSSEGAVTFVISVAVKDGKFRYQLYDFMARGVKSRYNVSYDGVEKQEEAFPFEAALEQYRKGGKNRELARQYLADMIAAVAQFNKAVEKAVAGYPNDISNF